jgi:GT2 family glycosyltransferase
MLPDLGEKPRVSVVIPMFNESEAIGRCLQSVFEQDYPADQIEVLVADGGSTDGSREKVREMAAARPGLRLLDNPGRRTPAGLNVGVRNAAGDVIIILGAHTRIEKDFIRQNIEAMKRMRVPCTGGTQINIGETDMQRAIGVAMGSPFGLPSAPYRFVKKEKFVDTVVYAAYRKELFDEVGLFDEDRFISEDAEFNWRLRKAGRPIFYTPKIVSYYFPRKTVKSLFQQLYRYGILRVNVIRKHPDALKGLHVMPVLLAAGILVLACLRWFQPILVLAAMYAFLLVLFSVIGALRSKMKFLFILLLLFMVIHSSWALGFITGIFRKHEKCPST